MMTKLTHRPSATINSRRMEYATPGPNQAEIDNWRRALDKVRALCSDELFPSVDILQSSRRLQAFIEGPPYDSADDCGLDDNSTIKVLDDYASFSRKYHNLLDYASAPSDDGASILPLINSDLVDIRGVVKWYDELKGYGFIASDGDEPDILIQFACLRASGIQTIHQGSRIHCHALRRGRGLMAFRVFGVEDRGPPGQPIVRDTREVIAGAESEWETATVKWFNRIRGFGLMTTGQDDPNIFVNASLLRRCGLPELRPGQIVSVRWRMGSKGRMAAEIRLLR